MVVFLFDAVRRLFPAECISKIEEKDTPWVSKVWIRIVSSIFCLIAIPCLAQSIVYLKSEDIYASRKGQSYYYDITLWLLPPWPIMMMGFCLVWNVANSLVLRLQSRPIHPGINVGIELCNWIGLVVTVSMLASLGTAFDTWSDSSVPQYRFNEIGTRVVALERSGITFGLALIILHFALFVYACRETEKINQRNRQARLTSAVQKATEDMRKRSPSPSKTKSGNGILCERCHCDVRDRRVSAHDLESSFGITPIEQPPGYVTDLNSENQDAGDRNSTLQAKRKTGRNLTLATAVSERDVSPVSPE